METTRERFDKKFDIQEMAISWKGAHTHNVRPSFKPNEDMKSFIESEVSRAVSEERERILKIAEQKKGRYFQVQWEGIEDETERQGRIKYNEIYTESRNETLEDIIRLITQDHGNDDSKHHI